MGSFMGLGSASLVAIAVLAITVGRSEALPEPPRYQAATPRPYTVEPNPRPDGKRKVTFADGTFTYLTITADGAISREEFEVSEIVLPSGTGIVRGEIAGANTRGVVFGVGKYVRLELFRNSLGLLRGHYSARVEGEGRTVPLSSLFAADADERWMAQISDHPEMLLQTIIKPAECADPELVPSGWIIWWVGCSATIPPAVYSPDGQRRIIKQPGGIFNISSGDDWILAGSMTHDGQRFTIGDVRRNHIAIEATESGMTGASVSFTGAWFDLRPDGVGTCLQSVGRAQESSEPCAFRNGTRVDLAHFARVDAVEQERAALEAEREAREAYRRQADAEVRQIVEARQREHDQILAAQSREQRQREQERDQERAAVFGGLVNDLGDMVDRAAADMEANNRAFAEAQENIGRAAERDRQYRSEQEARQLEEQGRASQSGGQSDAAEAARRAAQARQNAEEARRRVAQIDANREQEGLRIRQADERGIADEQRAAEAGSQAWLRSRGIQALPLSPSSSGPGTGTVAAAPTGQFSNAGLQPIPRGTPGPTHRGSLTRRVSAIGSCSASEARLTYNLQTLLGDPQVSAEWDFTGTEGCSAPSTVTIWVRLEVGPAFGYVQISTTAPTANRGGGTSFGSTGLDWSDAACGFDGSREAGCLSEEEAKSLWVNGRVTGFEIGW